ncbi:MAG TPA: carbon storage regulator CsrA [Clostridiales bacterium]|nr:carbon storage regulator CsrA [Clostridiales bacterium]
MLVLTRKKGEALIIGDNIELQVVDIQGDKVRLGINAPRDVSILRKELREEIKQANKEAVASSPGISLDDLGSILKK